MRKYNFVILCLLMLKQPLVFGQDSGIIYGHNHAYVLTSPKGWVLDNSSGVNQGFYAVFYPVGSSWAGAVTVMYTNVVRRDLSKKEKLQDIMQMILTNLSKILQI